MSQIHATLPGADELISAAVRGLIAQRRINTSQVAQAANMSRAALYRKLGNESPWQAAEVDRLAQFFAVSRDSLYEGRADFRSVAPASLADVGTRSSTDRASDYGSKIGRSWRSRRRADRRRRSGVVPLHLAVDDGSARAIA